MCRVGTPLPDRGTQKLERVRCITQMLAMFEPQGPKRLTDVVNGDGTSISLYGMPSKQANMVCIDKDGDRPVVVRPGFQSKTRLFAIFINHAEPLVVEILRDKTTTTSRHYVDTVLS